MEKVARLKTGGRAPGVQNKGSFQKTDNKAR